MKTPKIDSYRFGEIIIDGQAYHKDVIIYPHGVSPNWRREAGHSLSIADLTEVLRMPPQVLVLGQGAYGRMAVPAATREQVESAGVEIIVQATREACTIYNRLRDEKAVVAALHLTC